MMFFPIWVSKSWDGQVGYLVPATLGLFSQGASSSIGRIARPWKLAGLIHIWSKSKVFKSFHQESWPCLGLKLRIEADQQNLQLCFRGLPKLEGMKFQNAVNDPIVLDPWAWTPINGLIGYYRPLVFIQTHSTVFTNTKKKQNCLISAGDQQTFLRRCFQNRPMIKSDLGTTSKEVMASSWTFFGTAFAKSWPRSWRAMTYCSDPCSGKRFWKSHSSLFWHSSSEVTGLSGWRADMAKTTKDWQDVSYAPGLTNTSIVFLPAKPEPNKFKFRDLLTYNPNLVKLRRLLW